MNTAGLSTDQAPPLRVPVQFFVLVPLAFIVAGAFLALGGRGPFTSSWLPTTLALTHVLTLGGLGAAVLGALYQMVPVVAGRPVPRPGLSHGVLGLYTLGATALVTGFALLHPALVGVGGAALLSALLLFIAPVGWAVARGPASNATVAGMRAAVGALAVLVALGVRLAAGHAGLPMPADRVSLLLAHAGLGVLGVAGGLIAAIGWQVVPMFFLAPAVPTRWTRGVAWMHATACVAAICMALAGLGAGWVAAALAPAALAVWGLQPALQLRALAARKRRRSDASLDFWRLGLASGAACLPLAALAALTDWGPAPMLLGFVALWGWALALVHGMLTRIVPFLAWFHAVARPGADVGAIAPMRQRWTDARVSLGLRCHAAALLLGVVGLALDADAALRLAGVAMTGAGLVLAVGIRGALRG